MNGAATTGINTTADGIAVGINATPMNAATVKAGTIAMTTVDLEAVAGIIINTKKERMRSFFVVMGKQDVINLPQFPLTTSHLN